MAGKEPALQRTLKLTAAKQPCDNLYFRAAVGNKIEQLGDGWYRIDGWKMKHREQRDAADPPSRRQDGIAGAGAVHGRQGRRSSRNSCGRAMPSCGQACAGQVDSDISMIHSPDALRIVFLCSPHRSLPRSRVRRQGKKNRPKPATARTTITSSSVTSLPKGEVLEAGAIEIMPDGKVAVGTRRGEIWMIDNAYADDPEAGEVHPLRPRPARGARPGPEGRLALRRPSGPTSAASRTPHGDGKADLFEVVTDGWEINGDYHEYAFGSRFDKDGNIWITLCLTGSFNSNSKFRGWARQGDAGGQDDSDHQRRALARRRRLQRRGRRLLHRQPGAVERRLPPQADRRSAASSAIPTASSGTRRRRRSYLGDAPQVPKSGSRIMTEAKRIPQLMPPAVTFPYGKMGQSASGIDCDLSGGKFGPFEKQLFVGDQTHSTVMRVFLEKVNGRYQGACFPFRQGFGSGNVPVRFGKDGSLFVGGTSRGWGSRGTKPFAIERLVWTGKVPFEIHEMRAKPDGFELTFTQPIDPETAGKVESYQMKTFTYIYQAVLRQPRGGPDHAEDHQG